MAAEKYKHKFPRPFEFQWIFEASPTPYLILTPDLYIVAVNNAYLKATHTEREAICGRFIFEVFPDNPDDPRADGVGNLAASLAKVLETRAPDAMPIQKYDVQVPKENGKSFEEHYWSPINSPVLDQHGKVVYIIHRVEDVTAYIYSQRRSSESIDEKGARLIELETELMVRNKELYGLNERLRRANRELAKLDQAKTEFFQNVSHEFRTPLTLLIGPLEQVQQATGALDEEQRSQLALAYRNALRLLKLVSALLDFSSVESGHMKVTLEQTDLSALTSELVSNFRSTIERAGLRLIVHCPPLPKAVFVDRDMWEKIVLNLVSNAFKFTMQGEIEVALQAQDGHVELSVRDTGTGIPEKELPHLFERFHRIEEKGARVQEGAGIGLALTQDLVKLHGGTIRVESTYGRGSRFVVHLPVGSPAQQAGAAQLAVAATFHSGTTVNTYVQEALTWLPEEIREASIEAGAAPLPAGAVRARILVIDDNPDMRGYLSRLFSEYYDVQSVADAASALARIRRSQPDLVLTDIMMTGMDGFEFLKILRNDPVTAALPVIVVSGADSQDDLVKGLVAGADDYLVKPFKAKELLARVAAHLAQSEHTRREQARRQEAEAVKLRLQLILESVADAVAGVSADGTLVYLNSRAAERAGQRESELIGRDLAAIFPGGEGRLVHEQLARVVREHTAARVEFCGENEPRWFETRIFPAPAGAVIFSADITWRKHAEQEIKEALARSRMAAEIAGLGFWEWDIGNDAVFFSPEWKKQLGYEDAELPNQIEEWKSRLHPEDKDRVLKQLARLPRVPAPNTEIEYRLRHKDGSYRWFITRWLALATEHGKTTRLIITHLDVTAQKNIADQLRYVASHDPLTGMPNRLLLYEFAEHMAASARRSGGKLAVLFFDLDGFKSINDTHGHKIGDQVLQEAARRIARSIRSQDMAGRLGGDEFVAVLAQIKDERDIVQAAVHVLDSLDRPYLINGLELRTPSSIGISVFPDDGETIDALIQNADLAMYQAKAAGGGNYSFFAEEHDRQTQQRSSIESRMKADLDQHAFRLVYQPVFDSESGNVISVEALIRWPGPSLDPDEFIPVAEASGLIHPLGRWTLDEVCRQLLEWAAKGLPSLPIAINLSPQQFLQKNFSRMLARTLTDSGIAPGCIHLEVHEAAVLENLDKVTAVLDELQHLGVKVDVDIDDAEHGDAHVAQLSRLPIDTLKLNTQNFGPAQSDSILALSRKLGLDVVAERIETQAALDAFRQRNCRKVQGFHLCRPLSGEEFADWYWHRAAA